MVTDAHARRSDPISSHETVGRLARAKPMREQIIDYAYTRFTNYLTHGGDAWFTDTMLWEYLEHTSGRRLQRNVVARTRGLLERESPAPFVRTGETTDHLGHRVITFSWAPGAKREDFRRDKEHDHGN